MATTSSESRADCDYGSASPIMDVYFRASRSQRINPEWLRETRAVSGVSVQELMDQAREQLPRLYRLMMPPLLRRDLVMLYADALAHAHFKQFAARVEGYRPFGNSQWVDTDMVLIVVLGAPEFVELAFGSPWWSQELLDDMNRWIDTVSLPARDASCEFYYTERAAMIRWQSSDMFTATWHPDYSTSANRLSRVVEAAANGGELKSDSEQPRKGGPPLAEIGRLAAGYLRLAQQHQQSFVWEIRNGRLVIASRPTAQERRRKVGPQHATLESLDLIGKRRSQKERQPEDEVDRAVGDSTPELDALDELLRVRAIIERRRRAAKPNSARWRLLGRFEDLASGASVRSLAAEIGMDESTLRAQFGREREAIARELRRA
jgi:hypothetical protein